MTDVSVEAYRDLAKALNDNAALRRVQEKLLRRIDEQDATNANLALKLADLVHSNSQLRARLLNA